MKRLWILWAAIGLWFGGVGIVWAQQADGEALQLSAQEQQRLRDIIAKKVAMPLRRSGLAPRWR